MSKSDFALAWNVRSRAYKGAPAPTPDYETEPVDEFEASADDLVDDAAEEPLEAPRASKAPTVAEIVAKLRRLPGALK